MVRLRVPVFAKAWWMTLKITGLDRWISDRVGSRWARPLDQDGDGVDDKAP